MRHSENNLQNQVNHGTGPGRTAFSVQPVQNKLQFRRSSSIPNNMEMTRLQRQVSTNEEKHTKKRFAGLKKIFKRGSNENSQSPQGMSKENSFERQASETAQAEAELQLAHQLMKRPDDMGLRTDMKEPVTDGIQTILPQDCISSEAIEFGKLLKYLDITNGRVTILNNLTSTAILASDDAAINFLQTSLERMRRKQNHLVQEADDTLPRFFKNPSLLLINKKTQKPGANVMFNLQGGEEEDNDLKWEMSSLNLGSEYGSSESDSEGPAPEDVRHLTKEIKKAEGTRFKVKRKLRHHHSHKSSTSNKPVNLPPPPNPLGHSNRQLMRSHTTVPSGLCKTASSNSLSSAGTCLSRTPSRNATLPFNLLSLTGQLSWLVSEYVERGSSTYKWATDIIQSIGKMSVTRATWLNIHQQLRETTELLYTHRSQALSDVKSETPQGELAWSNLQATYQAIIQGDLNASTVTASRVQDFYKNASQTDDTQLIHLSNLLERKLHLAYVCDLLLWKAHKYFSTNIEMTEDDMAKHQLMDFYINLLELQLDQANGQNWCPALIDWILYWMYRINEGQSVRPNDSKDEFCLNELKTFKKAVLSLDSLVQTIRGCKMIQDALQEIAQPEPREFDEDNGLSPKSSSSDLSDSHHHFKYHPHHLHYGQGGFEQDLRCLDAERCSRTYSDLIMQIQNHAMRNRPLSYFAHRALYDMVTELNCPVDWNERLTSLCAELVKAWKEWEVLIKNRIDPDI